MATPLRHPIPRTRANNKRQAQQGLVALRFVMDPARGLLAVVATALASAAALAARPAPVTSYPPDWPHRVPFKLNRELLLPETERIVFVVDAPRGSSPHAEALDHLAMLASKHGGRPASWVWLGDPGAPGVRWIDPPVPPKPVKYFVRLRTGVSLDEFEIPRDDIDTIRLTAEIPTCPAPLSAELSFVFVRYLGKLGTGYGSTTTVAAEGACGGREFPVIRLAQTTIAAGRAPGIGQSFLEQRALAHEYGHLLGLGTNPAHGRWCCTIPYRGGAHCVHRDCAVSVPTATALLKGQMLDYCAACSWDIQEAREHWRTGKEFPEARRLAQPDPAVRVAGLKKYNFCEGCEADKLVGYGKAVMPALVARLAELPGGSASSPRSYAAHLAVEIILAEHERRQPPGSPALTIPELAADDSAAILDWWRGESERFMGGDEWSLPSLLRH